MLLGAIGVLIQCTVRVQRKQPIHRAAFSAAAVVIAVQLAGMGWRALGGDLTQLSLANTVLPLAVCAITYFAVNTGLVAGAIAVTSIARSAAVPQVPTVAESGYPGFDATNWFGAMVRAGTPKASVERLSVEIGRALQLPEVNDALSRVGLTAGASTPNNLVGQTIRRLEALAG